MRIALLFFSILFCSTVVAQENYTSMTRHALETMWKAKNETGYKKALEEYEEAFKIFPDSIDETGLYKASVLASELKEYDKAFKYLSSLTSEENYLGWRYVVGNYSENEYKNLLLDSRWNVIKIKAQKDKEQFYFELKEEEDEFYSSNPYNLNIIEDEKALYEKIKNFNPYKSKRNQDYSLSFEINDSTTTSFFVHLPENYTPEKEYSLLFFLHGAVRNNALVDYQLAHWNLGGWNRYYTKYATQNEVILVFPRGNRQYNWMTSDDGFFMIPGMLKLLKKAINIDDNKVFISGHSNGATGSFSYLMKQPSEFAGFYGFNTYPKVFTGGTFVENIKNRSFINFSTDEDYYYPPNANDDFTKLMNRIKADYKEHRYNGFPHWFPQFDESESAVRILFEDIKDRKRNPFPKEISWEFDNEKYGSIDWISDIKLDTLNRKADWHKEQNFKIDKWLEFEDLEDDDNDNLITKEVDLNALDFPRKSGKIRAGYVDNEFRIETSRIQSLSILISPEMVDLKKKIKIYVNGKLYYRDKINFNQEFMLNNFDEHRDREQVWVNKIDLKI